MKTWLLLLTVMPGLCGCGPAFLPQPTEQPVSQTDVAGTWTFRAFRTMTENGPAVYYTCTMAFATSGTFNQTIQFDGVPGAMTNAGTWALDESRIRLHHLLEEEWNTQEEKGEWKASQSLWWMTHVPHNDPERVLFGGLFPDPDAYHYMRKERRPAGSAASGPAARSPQG